MTPCRYHLASTHTIPLLLTLSFSLGIDVSGVFAEMIMSVATRDIVNKKMIYLYLSTYARKQSGLAILLINTLQKDSVDEDELKLD